MGAYRVQLYCCQKNLDVHLLDTAHPFQLKQMSAIDLTVMSEFFEQKQVYTPQVI
jgi:hypothetical protein